MNIRLGLNRCLILLATTVGCSTVVTSERFTGTQEGIRYALPITILEVLPQPDGSITVMPKYLADPNNEYVLRTSSFMSSYTLEVKAGEDRLLQSVTLDQDSTAVADAAVKAASEVAKQQIETLKGERDKEATERKTAVSAVTTAQANLDKAEAKLRALKDLAKSFPGEVSNKDIITAEIAVAEYRAQLKSAQAMTDRLGISSFDAPAVQAAQFPQAWGPVYYRVEQKRDSKTNQINSVKLISFEFPNKAGQDVFDTSTVARAVADKPIPASLTVRSLQFDQAGKVTLQLEVNTTITQVLETETKVFSQADPTQPLPVKPITTLGNDKKTLLVSVHLTPGDYILLVNYRDKDGGPIQAPSISFKVGK